MSKVYFLSGLRGLNFAQIIGFRVLEEFILINMKTNYMKI